MIIDFHTHVFSPRIKQNRDRYINADPCFALLYGQKNAKLATADELVANMDKEEVDISVITNIGWTTHDLCVETNDYILESIARYPNRLIGFGAVQPQAIKASVAEIERCVSGGIKGIGELRPDMQLMDLNDSQAIESLAETLKEHRLILLTHASEPVGHNYPGKGAVTPGILYPLITSFPGVTIVCAHWGGGLPFYALMPEVKRVITNVYFDTAASPLLYSPQVYHQVIQLVGDDRILFGSDWPVIAPGRLLAEFNSLDLPEGTKDLILSANARRLLGIKDRQDKA